MDDGVNKKINDKSRQSAPVSNKELKELLLYFNSSLNNLTTSIKDLNKQQQILNKNSEKNNTNIKKDLNYISNKINVTWDCYNSSLTINKRSKSLHNSNSNIEINDFIDCKDSDKDCNFPGKCIIKNVLNRESSVSYLEHNQCFNCLSSKEVKDINTQVRKICSKKNLTEKQLIILFNNNVHNTSITNNASIVNFNNKNISGANNISNFNNAKNSSFNNNTVIHGNKPSLDSNINKKQLNKHSSSRVNKSTLSPTKNTDNINKNDITNNHNIINNSNNNSNSSITNVSNTNTNYFNINNNKNISEKNSLLTTEFYAYQETISVLPELENQYLKTMKNLESFITKTDINNNITKTPIKIKDIKANLSNNTNELKSIIRSLIFIKEKLKFNNSGLTEINKILNKEISNNSNIIKNNEKFCLNCHKMFNLNTKNKDELICIYHPDPIKYYSCKGCGKDEYHSCCSKCSKCSVGCKKGKHVCEL